MVTVLEALLVHHAVPLAQGIRFGCAQQERISKSLENSQIPSLSSSLGDCIVKVGCLHSEVNEETSTDP